MMEKVENIDVPSTIFIQDFCTSFWTNMNEKIN